MASIALYVTEVSTIWTKLLGTYNLAMGILMLYMGIRFKPLLARNPAFLVNALAIMIMLRLMVEVFFFIDLTSPIFYLRVGVFILVYTYLIRSVKRLAREQAAAAQATSVSS